MVICFASFGFAVIKLSFVLDLPPKFQLSWLASLLKAINEHIRIRVAIPSLCQPKRSEGWLVGACLPRRQGGHPLRTFIVIWLRCHLVVISFASFGYAVIKLSFVLRTSLIKAINDYQ